MSKTFYKKTPQGLHPLHGDDIPDHLWDFVLVDKTTFQQMEKAAVMQRHYEGLNQNLLRIAKERANADRGLTPKREHSGFVILSSQEKELTYTQSGMRKTAEGWETTIQTWFSVDFTAEQVSEEVDRLLFDEDEWLIGKIGIDSLYLDGYEKLLVDRESAGYLDGNCVVKIKHRANFRTGYWEVVLVHTKQLGVVPPELRPAKK